MNKYQKIVFIFITLFLGLSPITTLASEFNHDYLISDTEIRDYKAMNLADIQAFLNKMPGTLKDYITVNKEGQFITAAQAFYEIGQRWIINPKYLMVLTQKEMGLLEDQAPSQRQYDLATGYMCPDSGGCDPRWNGFYKQINSAAAETDNYLNAINTYNFKPGRTYSIDGESVTPKNTATAGLYNYTPHIHGNELFWTLWNKYFSKKWPDGTLVKSSSTDAYYFIDDAVKRAITSPSVLMSRFDISKAVLADDADLAQYDDGVPIKYVNYSLLQSTTTNEVFMIVDADKRKFSDTALIKSLGFNEDEIMQVPDIDLMQYKDGSPITKYTIYPLGKLVQDQKTKETWQILNGVKRLVTNKEILDSNFLGQSVTKIAGADLDQYMTGNPVPLPDGSLVKLKTAYKTIVNKKTGKKTKVVDEQTSTIYVISNGKRLPISSGDVFKSLGYSSKNVLTITKETLEVHSVGQTIAGNW